MSLVDLCSYQACSKTTFAQALAIALRNRSQPVIIVNDDGTISSTTSTVSSSLERNIIYGSTASEKRYRSSAGAAAERALDGRATVILDAPNYVKGYRYELWCMAQQHNTRYCDVHVTATTSTDTGYEIDLLTGLKARFESPDNQNRWDCPLHFANDIKRADEIAQRILSSEPLTAIRATATPAKRPTSDVLGILDQYTRATEFSLLELLRSGLIENGAQLEVNAR